MTSTLVMVFIAECLSVKHYLSSAPEIASICQTASTFQFGNFNM